MLGKPYRVRTPFTLRSVPFLGRLYLEAYHRPDRFWRSRMLRVLLKILRAGSPSSTGEFEYERLGQRHRVVFNAKNFQFQALYAPFYQTGFEPEVAMLIDALLPEGGTFFDIGSNWGYFSLCAASCRQKVEIHAFEPQPATYQDLTQCVQQAGLSQVVTCHNVALSSSDGEASITIPDGLHSGTAEVSLRNGGQRVPMRRLDSLGLPAPGFIKMDVEGHETEVLRGGVEVLKSARPFIVFESKPSAAFEEKSLEPLFFLKDLGYRLYAPALQRHNGTRVYYQQDYTLPASPGDSVVLIELAPEERLLWPAYLNLLACHEERLPQLAASFGAGREERPAAP